MKIRPKEEAANSILVVVVVVIVVVVIYLFIQHNVILSFHSTFTFCNSIFLPFSVDAAKEDDSLGGLVNDDNIEPNSRIRTITVEGQPHLCLLAIEDIRPGEEITYNDDWPWRSKVQKEICYRDV